KSVLENMHLAESFLLTQDNPNCDIWVRMKDKTYREMRKAIIEMVLATDLSMHLQLVGSLKSMIISDEKHDIANDPMILMRASGGEMWRHWALGQVSQAARAVVVVDCRGVLLAGGRRTRCVYRGVAVHGSVG
ncbi:hypothetical protein AaE_000771, partial [Aphanomyces astaci]